MTNVILDISPLGLGFYHRQARTGISRVIEKLLMGLHNNPAVALSLAAPTNLSETMRYARHVLPANTPPFINPTGEQTWARLENALLSPFGLSSLPSKAIRQVFYQTRNVTKTGQARFDVHQFPAKSVYHSTFFPLPDAIRGAPSVQKVVTIYDLIPILHPEWFNETEDTVRRTIASIPPDGYVVTISQATKDDFCHYTGFDPSRVIPILLAASPDLFFQETDLKRQQTVRQRFGIGDGPYLLSLATLEPRKNIDHLIRCFVRLVESGELAEEVNLVLVGTKGWKFDKILDEVGRNDRTRSRIIVTGFVPDEDLAALYSGALAFAYPSLYEGFGLPPLEAMQCGLPVITSNVSSLPEVVGEAAIQVAPTDSDALCEAILTMVNKATVRQQMAAKAIERATLFSWERFVAEHIALYQKISG